MEICHHHIAQDEIVGIGPLMSKRNSDQVVDMMYKARQLNFYLHLRNQSILIESDWFYLDGCPADQLEKNKAAYEKFVADYNDAAESVKMLIGDN